MPYCGYDIAAWRAIYCWCRWLHRGEQGEHAPAVERANRHNAVLETAAYLLPLEWHQTHQGRLSPSYTARRQGMAPPLPRAHRYLGGKRKRGT